MSRVIPSVVVFVTTSTHHHRINEAPNRGTTPTEAITMELNDLGYGRDATRIKGRSLDGSDDDPSTADDSRLTTVSTAETDLI